MAWAYEHLVKGHLASKANGRRFIFAQRRSIKSESALTFCDDFAAQVRRAKEPFCGPVKLTVKVHYIDWRRDLDIALLQDCIQKAGIIANDRMIVKIEAERFIDRVNPRVWFRLDELPDYQSE